MPNVNNNCEKEKNMYIALKDATYTVLYVKISCQILKKNYNSNQTYYNVPHITQLYAHSSS